MPNKYTRKLSDRICESISNGLPIKAAAELCGVPLSTVYYWRRKHPSFEKKLRVARARAQQHLIDILKKAAPKDTKAAMFLLERCWPEEYGRAWKPFDDRQRDGQTRIDGAPYGPRYAKPPLDEEERRRRMREIFDSSPRAPGTMKRLPKRLNMLPEYMEAEVVDGTDGATTVDNGETTPETAPPEAPPAGRSV